MKKNLIVTLVAIGLLFYSLPSSKAAVVLNSSEYIGFNVSGGEIGRITTTGFGIGISPSYALDIVGKGRFSQGLILSSLTNCGKLYTDANGNVVCGSDETGITGSGTTNYIPIWTSSSSLGNSVIYQNGGNIGIGTTSPSAKLDVAGNVRVIDGNGVSYKWQNNNENDFFGVGMWNSTTDRLEWYYYNGSTYKWAAMTFCVNHDLSNPRLTIGGYCTGNSRNLYVYGTGEFTSNLYAPIFYDRDNTGYYINPAGASNLNTIQLNDANTKILEGSNNAVRIQTNSGYVDVGPQNTGYTHFSTDRPAFWFNKQVQVNGGVIAAYNSHMYLQAPQGTTRIFVNKDNGNVGIGTTSPGAKLDVNGNVYIRGNNFRITSDGTGDTYLDIYGKDGGSWDAQLRFFNYTGNLIHLFHTGDRSRLVLVTGYDGNAEKAFEVQGNLYVTSGNVGIGTTSPSAKLDIAGNSEINGYLYLNKGSNSDMKIDFQNDAWGGGGDDAWIKYYSESGENTKLQIGVSNDANDDLELYQYGNWRLRLESGNILMNGNVGIGTTSFSSGVKVEIAGGDLDLNGNKIQRVTGIDTDTSMNVWMGGGTLDAEGGKIIGVNEIQASVFKDRDNTGYYLDPASTGDSVHVAGTIRMGLGTPGGAVPTLNLYAKGYNSTNVEVQDRATWYMNVNASWVDKRTLSLWYYPGDKIGGCCHHLASFGVKSDGSNYVYFAPKVGIGTTNPSYTLDVAGDIHASGTIYGNIQTSGLTLTGDLNMQDHSILDANNVETNAIYDPEDAYLSVADNVYFTVNGTRLYLKSKGGQTYAGIYTTSTSNRLFIRADNADDVAEFASYGLYLPKDVSTGLYVGGGIQLDYAQKGYDLKFDGTNDHSIYQGSHEAIRFLGDSSNVYFPGNVGIGTTSPGAKLDVRGAATIGDDRSSSGFLRITGTGGINYIESGTTTSSGSAADIRFTDMYAAHTWMTIKSNGNIGIGTTTPSYKLDVSGTIRARDVFGAGGKNIIIGDDVYLSDIDTANTLGIYGLQDSTKGNIKLGSNGPILYGYNGNLGIGTTSPGAKLDVNGDIQINGGSATGTYKVKGHRNFYAGDETEVSTTSTTYKEVKYFTAVFDDTYGIKPRYVNVIARIWNGASSKTTYLNVTFRGCNGIVLTTTSTSPAVVKGTIDVSSCANGLYPVDIYLKTTSGGTAYNDLIEFYYVE